MNTETEQVVHKVRERAIAHVLLFWVGYVAITWSVGFATSTVIRTEVWQLTAWGFISSAGLLALSFWLRRRETSLAHIPGHKVDRVSMRNFLWGLLLGAASFGIHVAVVSTFSGPIHFEWVPGIGIVAALIFFGRFFSTSCMEELGFRGVALQGLIARVGVWPAVCLTAVVFGLSHLMYGWDMQTIALGVIPGGMLWGMSAVTTKGIAMPIGLHAAWNFVSWSAGNRAETGRLKMIVEEHALEQTQIVGTISYVLIFALLTIAFWIAHKTKTRHIEGGKT